MKSFNNVRRRLSLAIKMVAVLLLICCHVAAAAAARQEKAQLHLGRLNEPCRKLQAAGRGMWQVSWSVLAAVAR